MLIKKLSHSAVSVGFYLIAVTGLFVGILLGNPGYYFTVELFIVLREGTAIFDMFGLALSGQPMDVVAVSAFGPERAQQVLGILQSPGAISLSWSPMSLTSFPDTA